MSVTDAARLLGMSSRNTRYLCTGGALSGWREGRAWRVEASQVAPDALTGEAWCALALARSPECPCCRRGIASAEAA